jgi:hypothetical protein
MKISRNSISKVLNVSILPFIVIAWLMTTYTLDKVVPQTQHDSNKSYSGKMGLLSAKPAVCHGK